MSKTPHPDTERIEWLGGRPQRLYDLYWHIQKTDEDLRSAIDRLSALEPTQLGQSS